MRVAFLIMAHRYPEALARLVARLKHPDVSFVVHINARVDAAPFRQAVRDEGSVTFVSDPDRIAVQWAGLSFTLATLALLRTALAMEMDRFVLLSIQDYPTMPVEQIIEQVGQDQEIIGVDRICRREGDGWFDRCAYQLSFADYRWLNPQTGNRLLVELSNYVASRMPRRSFFTPIYYGPTWWSLTNSAVSEILDFIDRHPKVLRWFSHTRAPDEMIYQTILKQSSRSDRIRYDDTDPHGRKRPRGVTALHYIEFEGASPRILDIDDLPAIVESGAPFTRKLDPVLSAALMNALDDRARQPTSEPDHRPA